MIADGKISTGKLSRSASMGLAATKIGLKQLGHMGRQKLEGLDEAERRARAEENEREIGRILFQALNQLKGTALKASQILSMEVDFLPKGIREELSKACYQATPLNSALVHKAFRKEFRKSPSDMFDYFDSQAFSAASLGQVHFARLQDGEKVAVKIQYPGIAASIQSDVKMISNLLMLLSNATDIIPNRKVTGIVMDEIEKQLAREVDYEQEADNIDWFAENITLPGIRLPGVLREMSGARILVMEYLTGDHLEDWLAGNPSQSERDRYGQLLWDFFHHSVFELGCLHADPHPGNFLFLEDGDLGLIDFGCTKTVSPLFVKGIAEFYNLLIRHQSDPAFEELLEAYKAMELVDPHLELEEFRENLQPQLDIPQKWVIEPFLQPRFDFSAKEALQHLDMGEARDTMPYLKGMPRDILYFDRTYHGLVHMLRRMGAVVRTENAWIGPQHVKA